MQSHSSNDDFRDALLALSAARVEFVVVGAYALGAHGHMRATGDIDVLVRATPRNARRISRAIREFADVSLEYFGVTEADLSRAKLGFFMGVEPNRIDLLTRIAGVSFDRVWAGRRRAEIEGVPVWVIGLPELISSKRASAKKRDPGSAKQLQDLADVQWLLERRRRQP